MPTTSQPPPQSASGGSLKYILIGLLFLVGGGVIAWIAAGTQQPAAAPAPPPPPPAVPERANPMADQNLVLEEEPPPEPPPPEPEVRATPKPGHAKAAEWECSGELDQAAIKKKVNENYAQLRSCYERRLKVNNILQGDIKLRMKVSSSGKVVATSLSGSLKDAEVFNCVRNVAQSLSFATPTGGNCAVVSVPLSFSPKQ